jgi:hypothetical protein
MTKIHIALVGAQPMPVFNGIHYLKPKRVYLLHSEETRKTAENLKSVLKAEIILVFVEKPFNYEYCKGQIAGLIEINSDAELSFNISGGTKIMTIAANEIAVRLNLPSYYIDQNNVVTQIGKGQVDIIRDIHPLNTYFVLFGQTAKSTTKFEQVSEEYFQYKDLIMSHHSGFRRMFEEYRKKSYTENADFSVENNSFELSWHKKDKSVVLYHKKTGEEDHFTGHHVFQFFFNTGWFEVAVGEIISKWNQAKQIYWNTVLPRIANKNDKNEIDLIVDTGIKLFFIECKTSVYEIRDLDKFKNVVKNFGGLGSKAILVTYAKPKESVFEKCADIGITIFWIFDSKHNIRNNFDELIPLLNDEYHKINPV